tara:strand:+ start:31 stop:336 length:306 start_codon:yes stop_codon:yes gene_type:complete
MCGIIGVISKKSLKVSTIKKMNDAIAHRGPDGEGFFFVPDKYWFEGELNNWLVSSVNDSKFIQEEIKKVRLDIDLSKIRLKKIIRLLNISVWHKVFFRNNK